LSEHRDGDAEKILRRTLTLEPENAIALDLLGNVLAESGRFSQARETLLQAVARSPLLAGSYYEIARCRRIGPDDAPLVASMQAALAVPGLDAVQRSRVHLALGKAADDLGRYEVAMQHCDAAEALRNTLTPFDPGGLANRVDRLIACFTADLWERAPTAAPTGPSPILILGLPRSGTTLVEQIISSHPHVHAAGELPFWIERGTRWEAAIAGDAPVADIVAHTRAHAARGASDYLQRLRGLAPRAGWVTDKMPLNFQWAGLIHAALPHATLIHCRRVPIDTALSIHQTHFNPRMPFPTGGVGLVFYIRAYQRLCEHWRQVLPPKRFIEIDYEDLVGAPEIEIPRLISACGLTWHDACLRPEQNGRVVKTPSKWQARQPIHDTSRGRWRRYEPWLGALRALLDNVEPDERPV
jgi:tetratricopeptide (TPR) repeat protein